jgi:hypothetical protein
MLVRDVDKLDPLPDEKLRQLDEEYVVSRMTAHTRSMLLSHSDVQQLDAVCNTHALWCPRCLLFYPADAAPARQALGWPYV